MVRTECRGEAGVYLGFITHLREGGRRRKEAGEEAGTRTRTHTRARFAVCRV